MENSEFEGLLRLLKNGKLNQLKEKLQPFLDSGDLDARFLRVHFSIDPMITGDDFDYVAIKELKELANLGHARSIYAMASKYQHGDDVPKDEKLSLYYLIAAALLGHEQARLDLIKVVELEMGWSDLPQWIDSQIHSS